MRPEEVRLLVEEFRQRTAYGNGAEDCYPPWYLQQQYQLSDSQAIQQSADIEPRNYDFGVDAFHLYGGTPLTHLLLVQAKYSETTNLISNGFHELEKSLPEVKKILEGTGTDVPQQNKVLVNLRASVNQLDHSVREKLQLDLRVIHLNSQDTLVIGEKTRDARSRLREAVERLLPDRVSMIREVGPPDMGPRQETTAPASGITLTVEKLQDYTADSESKMYLGLGRLSELVELYNKRRDALFAKNVRYYLQSKKNVEKGPAGKMRETLKQICVENKLAPELFAFYHNGVTVTGRSAEPAASGIYVSEPYVLNGCQTIKNAFFFRNDPYLRDRIDQESWNKIMVPLRIVATANEELIRMVTINNNRQNAISYASLRSNEPVQIGLEQRFRAKGIFYERQEGAFTNLESGNPERFGEEYPNTNNRYVGIVNLARSIAAAMGEVGWAEHPGDLFESDPAYTRCFSDKRLSSITFLVLLQNVHDTITPILKSELGLEQKGTGPKPTRLKYYAMALLFRFLAKDNATEFVSNNGSYLCGGGGRSKFREELSKVLGTRHSGIRQELAEKFTQLESSDADGLQDAFQRALSSLRLRDADPFDVFRNL